jgi:hypothetical protein
LGSIAPLLPSAIGQAEPFCAETAGFLEQAIHR